MTSKYGPCVGVDRLVRYRRVRPPATIQPAAHVPKPTSCSAPESCPAQRCERCRLRRCGRCRTLPANSSVAHGGLQAVSLGLSPPMVLKALLEKHSGVKVRAQPATASCPHVRCQPTHEVRSCVSLPVLDLPPLFLDLPPLFLDLPPLFLDLPQPFLGLSLSFIDLLLPFVGLQTQFLDLSLPFVVLSLARRQCRRQCLRRFCTEALHSTSHRRKLQARSRDDDTLTGAVE